VHIKRRVTPYTHCTKLPRIGKSLITTNQTVRIEPTLDSSLPDTRFDDSFVVQDYAADTMFSIYITRQPVIMSVVDRNSNHQQSLLERLASLRSRK
jgi:hypothetical protein